MSAMEFENIRKQYGANLVLDIDALQIAEGERVALAGQNGSGKTTFLMIAALLSQPNDGKYKLFDDLIDWRNPQKNRHHITLVTQEPFFFSGTLRKNIAFGLSSEKLTKTEMARRIDQYTELLGLRGIDNRSPRTFSSGEKKRAAIARALVRKTSILLLDEPFAHCDIQSANILESVIQSLDRKCTVVFSTHELSKAYALADRIVTLNAGKIAPWTSENIFKFVARRVSDGSELITQSGLIIYYPDELVDGREYTASINSRDIIISLERFESSARNSFVGKIQKIESEGENLVGFTIVCANDFILKVTVTKRTLDSFKSTVGDYVWAHFKSSAIHVLK